MCLKSEEEQKWIVMISELHLTLWLSCVKILSFLKAFKPEESEDRNHSPEQGPLGRIRPGQSQNASVFLAPVHVGVGDVFLIVSL